MLSLKVLLRLASGYHHLAPRSRAALDGVWSGTRVAMDPRDPQDRAALEQIETWLQTADLEGIPEAGLLAREIRGRLYPIRSPRPSLDALGTTA